MRKVLLGLTVIGALVSSVGAQAGRPSDEPQLIKRVYWNGDSCGPRCQEHRWLEHERREERRQAWRHRRWEERRWEERHERYRVYP